jgi:hypothetical protein
MTVERCRILESGFAWRGMSVGRRVPEPDLARRAVSAGSGHDPARGAAS